jgi:hypothetical protein
MTINEAIVRAVNEGNARMAGSIADQMFFRHGWNYNRIYDLAKKLTGISGPDWDALMYEADRISGG